MKKKIGILGGISSASTIQYYRKIMDLYYRKHQDYYYPEMIIYSLDFQAFTDMENENRMEDYKDYILYGIKALSNAGAEFVAMSANSPHSVIEDIRSSSPLPFVSIVDSVAQQAIKSSLKKVLLTGIKYTMQSSFYQTGMAKYGVEVIVPDQNDQVEIDNIIFEELVLNIIKSDTRKRFKQIIAKYDVEGVILGCTELPLLLQQNESDIPLLDSMDIHCQDILRYSLNL